jgi:hypothetical protein
MSLAQIFKAGVPLTVTANGNTPVAVADAKISAGSVVILSLNTATGGTAGNAVVVSLTPGTGFSISSQAADLSVYNYMIFYNSD